MAVYKNRSIQNATSSNDVYVEVDSEAVSLFQLGEAVDDFILVQKKDVPALIKILKEYLDGCNT
jgi:hypothetical protein